MNKSDKCDLKKTQKLQKYFKRLFMSSLISDTSVTMATTVQSLVSMVTLDDIAPSPLSPPPKQKSEASILKVCPVLERVAVLSGAVWFFAEWVFYVEQSLISEQSSDWFNNEKHSDPLPEPQEATPPSLTWKQKVHQNKSRRKSVPFKIKHSEEEKCRKEQNKHQKLSRSDPVWTSLTRSDPVWPGLVSLDFSLWGKQLISESISWSVNSLTDADWRICM